MSDECDARYKDEGDLDAHKNGYHEVMTKCRFCQFQAGLSEVENSKARKVADEEDTVDEKECEVCDYESVRSYVPELEAIPEHVHALENSEDSRDVGLIPVTVKVQDIEPKVSLDVEKSSIQDMHAMNTDGLMIVGAQAMNTVDVLMSVQALGTVDVKTSAQDMVAMGAFKMKASAQDMVSMSDALETESAQDMCAMSAAVERESAQSGDLRDESSVLPDSLDVGAIVDAQVMKQVLNIVPQVVKQDENAQVVDQSVKNYLSEGVHSTAAGVILIKNNSNIAVLVMWYANKIRRVCGSTLEAETLSLVEGMGQAVYVKQVIEEMCGLPENTIPVHALIDHNGAYEAIHSTAAVEDRRLRAKVARAKDYLIRGNRRSESSKDF